MGLVVRAAGGKIPEDLMIGRDASIVKKHFLIYGPRFAW